jgi:AhpD family alkylhydroperoxidase
MRLSNLQQKFGLLYGELLTACDNQAAAAYVALQISKLNGCHYCIGMHTEELEKFTTDQVDGLELERLSAVIEGVTRCCAIEDKYYDAALIEYAILVNSFNRIGKLS